MADTDRPQVVRRSTVQSQAKSRQSSVASRGSIPHGEESNITTNSGSVSDDGAESEEHTTDAAGSTSRAVASPGQSSQPPSSTQPTVSKAVRWSFTGFLSKAWLAAILSIGGLVLAGVAFWPSFASQKDGHASLSLAQWTALKDFMEYCKENMPNSTTHPCAEVAGKDLPAPPVAMNFARRSLQWTASNLKHGTMIAKDFAQRMAPTLLERVVGIIKHFIEFAKPGLHGATGAIKAVSQWAASRILEGCKDFINITQHAIQWGLPRLRAILTFAKSPLQRDKSRLQLDSMTTPGDHNNQRRKLTFGDKVISYFLYCSINALSTCGTTLLCLFPTMWRQNWQEIVAWSAGMFVLETLFGAILEAALRNASIDQGLFSAILWFWLLVFIALLAPPFGLIMISSNTSTDSHKQKLISLLLVTNYWLNALMFYLATEFWRRPKRTALY